MTAAIVLAVCCILVTVSGWWLYLTRQQAHRKTHPGATVSLSALAESLAVPKPGTESPTASSQHRWSGRRPRLALTEDGLRDTGDQIRFCLDCAAEKTEKEPSI